jgi:cytochrome c-type biogenesis protein CcmH/NrfG
MRGLVNKEFLQGDLKGAAAAFQRVTEADPSNPDSWVNLGRVAVQEGDIGRALRSFLDAQSELGHRDDRADLRE